MRYTFLILMLFAACAGSNLLARGESQETDSQATSQQKSAAKQKPLRLQDDKPLLLLDDDEALEESGADNSRCMVCHLNIGMEELATTHAKQDIGCGADCHGECDKHIDDESWAVGGPGTPPDIMFPPEKIEPACSKCHETHDAPAQTVLKTWQQRCPEQKDFSKVVCTDCHGKHRLNAKLRKAWWDKKTGKSIKKKIEGGRP